MQRIELADKAKHNQYSQDSAETRATKPSPKSENKSDDCQQDQQGKLCNKSEKQHNVSAELDATLGRHETDKRNANGGRQRN